MSISIWPYLVPEWHDPDTVLDYVISWAEWLAEGESIAVSEWIVDGATAVDETATATTATVWIGAPTADQIVATNRITTDSTPVARIQERVLIIRVGDSTAAPVPGGRRVLIPPVSAPGGTAGSGTMRLAVALVDVNGTPIPAADIANTHTLHGLGVHEVGDEGLTLTLTTQDELPDGTYYQISVRQGRSEFRTTVQLPPGETDLTWAEFLALPNAVEGAARWYGITADERAAMDAANSPDADNPIATLADVGAGGAVESVDGQTGAVDLSGSYDALGAATSAVAAHAGATDPHTQYTTTAEAAAAASAAIGVHVAAVNPHAQYPIGSATQLLSSTERAALTAANAPSGSNPLATMDDIEVAGGPVTSWNTRTGAVVPAAGDYDGLYDPHGTATAAVAAHVAAGDPHTQYTTAAEAASAASAAVATHVGLADPHTQYTTAAEAAAEAADAVALHTAASDPHPQYLTQTEVQGLIDAAIAAALVEISGGGA